MASNAEKYHVPPSKISEEALAVRNALISAGLETPLIENHLSHQQKYDQIKENFAGIMTALGLDLSDDSLCETPHRIAKMYLDEIFGGLDYEQFPKITSIENKMQLDEMVMIKDISLTSTCEHHFVTIDGVARVAYIPEDRIIGLSKINRLVHFFAQRPQVQERLARQILVALQTLLNTENVALSINATHYCVKARGVKDANSNTQTTALGGVFKSDIRTRTEFFS
ncbi:GTP cyclohydrolase I FolE [Spongiibacter taiwanensis]|uniref:GTP cyclohydrolase I FolE n=1 Tax=Spongiibacter taiwanensis TaxID=1748242 RepID=UPI002035EAA8|nr:GTP cyclohydrolase I FolE [Spongiibacter taiwanensis]USA42819.1 GTP cyclohydrolase I FolE [Spongiibacter taiwanensis]